MPKARLVSERLFDLDCCRHTTWRSQQAKMKKKPPVPMSKLRHYGMALLCRGSWVECLTLFASNVRWLPPCVWYDGLLKPLYHANFGRFSAMRLSNKLLFRFWERYWSWRLQHRSQGSPHNHGHHGGFTLASSTQSLISPKIDLWLQVAAKIMVKEKLKEKVGDGGLRRRLHRPGWPLESISGDWNLKISIPSENMPTLWGVSPVKAMEYLWIPH